MGQILICGLMLTGSILVLNLIQVYVFNKLINPDFCPATARHAIETTNMLPDEAERYYGFHNLLIQGSIYRAVMGIVAMLVTGFAIRREK